jgi:hypothetical protein
LLRARPVKKPSEVALSAVADSLGSVVAIADGTAVGGGVADAKLALNTTYIQARAIPKRAKPGSKLTLLLVD